ncbi:MAG: ATP-grasp domain-containing protein [Candidatus Methylomirabilales bacterium]
MGMRIFIHEYVSGGGLSGKPLPKHMAHEGLLMLQAILEDFHSLKRHEIRSTIDARLRTSVSSDVPATLVEPKRYTHVFNASVDWAEAILLIAPETDGILAHLSSQVEHEGKYLLGSTSQAVIAAADKAITNRRFRASGLPTARTRVVGFANEPTRHVASFGYPAVVKPVDGAGAEGTSVIYRPAQISAALRRLKRATRRHTFLLQEYIAGIPASLSCLSDAVRVHPLTLNTQYLCTDNGISYRGGTVHIDHPRRSEAFGMVKDLYRTLPGLRGYFGVDLVLTRSGPVFIEVNPRLTTSYIGLRRACSTNLAEAILASALGRLPALPTPRGPVRFFVNRRRGPGNEKG